MYLVVTLGADRLKVVIIQRTTRRILVVYYVVHRCRSSDLPVFCRKNNPFLVCLLDPPPAFLALEVIPPHDVLALSLPRRCVVELQLFFPCHVLYSVLTLRKMKAGSSFR